VEIISVRIFLKVGILQEGLLHTGLCASAASTQSQKIVWVIGGTLALHLKRVSCILVCVLAALARIKLRLVLLFLTDFTRA